MDSEDAVTNSPPGMTMDRSPDSGVSIDSKDSSPAEAPAGFPAHFKEPSAKNELAESKGLDQMEVDLPGEQLPAEQKPTRPILKAHRGTARKPQKLQFSIQILDNMDDDDNPTNSRRPGTPFYERKRGMDRAFSVAEADPWKRSRHIGVSTDTISELPPALSTPAPVAVPPKDQTIQPSSKLHPLPSVPSPDSSAYTFIAAEVLAGRLSALAEAQFLEQYILVDCRYPYEYAGGHIKYSINIYNSEELLGIFFPQGEQLIKIKSRTPIFYCEFSQKRGPEMAHALRRLDRIRNEYPQLDHATIYVLRGGYKNFFESGYWEHCDPAGYMNMDNPSHRGELKKYTAHQKKKKSRSFGVSERIASSSDLEVGTASSSLQLSRHAATNAPVYSPLLSGDFARARIDSPPTTPKLKPPTKGEGRRLRFDS